MREQTDALLQEIQAAASCLYLSDLHQNHQSLDAQSKARIMAIPLARYSNQEWNAAASYILGNECRFFTAEEARAGIAASKQAEDSTEANKKVAMTKPP